MATPLISFGRTVCDVTGSTYFEVDLTQNNRFPRFDAKEEVLSYSVPAGKKLACGALFVTAYPSSMVSEDPGTTINFGKAELKLDGTAKAEWRIQGSGLLGNFGGADEFVAPWNNAYQAPSVGEGVVISSGSTLSIDVTSAAVNNGILWRASFIGTKGGAPTIQRAAATSESATFTAITYTPDADFTLKSFTLSAERFAHMLGFFAVEIDGQIVFESPMATLDWSQSMFNDEQSENPGSMRLPIEGLELDAGERMRVLVDPISAHNGVFAAMLTGHLSAVGSMRGVNFSGGIDQ